MSLATSLAELGLAHRLSWEEVERLLQLAQADVDQALDDQARFGVNEARARHVAIVYQLLGGTLPVRENMPVSDRGIPMELLA
jgi:hypothetical protein